MSATPFKRARAQGSPRGFTTRTVVADETAEPAVSASEALGVGVVTAADVSAVGTAEEAAGKPLGSDDAAGGGGGDGVALRPHADAALPTPAP